jgi:hypothetical protein
MFSCRDGTVPVRGELRKLQEQQGALQKEVETKQKQVSGLSLIAPAGFPAIAGPHSLRPHS